MSESQAYIRFDDGRIIRARYQNTADVMIRPATVCAGPCVPSRVQIAVDYAGGMWWNGTACRACGLVIYGAVPYGIESQAGVMLELECDIKRGRPDWLQVENKA